MKKKEKVLVVCTQNSARSQMAEAFLRKYGDDFLEVYSAGLEPTQINPYAIQVMAEIDMDIRDQQAKSVRDFLGKTIFSIIIGVCKNVEGKCPNIFPGAREIVSWPFDDPAAYEGMEADKLEMFRRVRNEIQEKVIDWVDERRKG